MLNNLTIKLRLILLVGFMAGVILITNGFGLGGINQCNNSVESLYTNKLVSTRELGNVRDRLVKERLTIANSIIFKDESIKNVELIEKTETELNKAWNIYAATPAGVEEQEIMDKFLGQHKHFVNEALNPAVAFIKAGEMEQLENHIREKIRPLYAPMSDSLDKLIQIQERDSKELYENSQENFKIIALVLISLVILALLVALISSRKVLCSILQSIRNVQTVANAIAAGDLNSKIDTSSNDEAGAMMKSMENMRNTLIAFVDAQEAMAKKHADGWIKEQIDETKFQGSYKTLAQSINHLVQSHIAVKMQIVDVVTQYSKGDFKPDMERLPGEKAKITAAIDAVKNSFLAVNTEIEKLAAAGAQGNFSKRADAEKFEFMFKSVLEYLNMYVETCDVGFNDVLRVANALAEGDLTQSITKDYPGVFGQAKVGMNTTTDNLKVLMNGIKETTEVIASSAKEIATGNNDLSHRTEEQAASLEETAASMHELTSTVQHNSENAKQANELAVGATDTANRGVTVVEQVVKTMENINESSLRIVDIISVIDDIAFQTNILALNAAVEAARAGEQGKGFAVVAVEVRNLAQRAANAAGEIKRLISDSVERVSGGSKQVADAGKTMQDIVNSIQSVTSIIAEIASASEQQSAGIAQVAQAIASMDDVTQQNAAMVEEIAAAAGSLESQTGNLSSEMSQFKTGNDSGNKRSVAKTITPAKSKPVAARSAPVKAVSTPNATFTVGNDDWEEF